MTDDTEPTKEVYGPVIPPEEHERRRERYYDMARRQIVLDEARRKDKLPPRPGDDESITFERSKKAGDQHERVNITMKINDVDVTTSNLRMLDGSVLDMLMSRRSITLDHYSAGSTLYEDWYISKIGIVSAVDTARDVVDGGKIELTSESRLIAAGNFAEAILAVGKVHSNALINIVLLEEDLATYARRTHPIKDDKDARYAGIVTLRNALTQLDHHYHGKRENQGGSSHAPDYRPSIQSAS